MNEPPVILVKTWYELLKDENPEVKERGITMLRNAFRSDEDIRAYLIKHKII